jgi:hypothetical protein
MTELAARLAPHTLSAGAPRQPGAEETTAG